MSGGWYTNVTLPPDIVKGEMSVNGRLSFDNYLFTADDVDAFGELGEAVFACSALNHYPSLRVIR